MRLYKNIIIIQDYVQTLHECLIIVFTSCFTFFPKIQYLRIQNLYLVTACLSLFVEIKQNSDNILLQPGSSNTYERMFFERINVYMHDKEM